MLVILGSNGTVSCLSLSVCVCFRLSSLINYMSWELMKSSRTEGKCIYCIALTMKTARFIDFSSLSHIFLLIYLFGGLASKLITDKTSRRTGGTLKKNGLLEARGSK